MIEASELPYKVLVSSKGRPELITKHPLLHVANVFVDSEEEREEYSENIAKAGKRVHAIHVVPPYKALGQKRQWVLDEHWSDDEPFAMMVDDDLNPAKNMMRIRSLSLSKPDDLLTLFWRSYQTAADMPTGLFGYTNSPNPMERSVNQPFGGFTTGHLDNQALGILDRELRYDLNPMLISEEVDLTLKCLEKYRVILKDMRFSFGNVGVTSGGLAGVRTSDAMQDDVEYLRHKWGSELVQYRETPVRNGGLLLKVMR